MQHSSNKIYRFCLLLWLTYFMHNVLMSFGLELGKEGGWEEKGREEGERKKYVGKGDRIGNKKGKFPYSAQEA